MIKYELQEETDRYAQIRHHINTILSIIHYRQLKKIKSVRDKKGNIRLEVDNRT